MTADQLISIILALGGLFTPLGIILTAIGVIMGLLRLKRLEAKQDAQGKAIEIVKTQNDGLISEMERQRTASQLKAEVATKDASDARAETVAATAEGDARVAEANRTHEVSAAAVEKGTHKAIVPIAKEAVAEGTKAAIEEMKKDTE